MTKWPDVVFSRRARGAMRKKSLCFRREWGGEWGEPTSFVLQKHSAIWQSPLFLGGTSSLLAWDLGPYSAQGKYHCFWASAITFGECPHSWRALHTVWNAVPCSAVRCVIIGGGEGVFPSSPPFSPSDMLCIDMLRTVRLRNDSEAQCDDQQCHAAVSLENDCGKGRTSLRLLQAVPGKAGRAGYQGSCCFAIG